MPALFKEDGRPKGDVMLLVVPLVLIMIVPLILHFVWQTAVGLKTMGFTIDDIVTDNNKIKVPADVNLKSFFMWFNGAFFANALFLVGLFTGYILPALIALGISTHCLNSAFTGFFKGLHDDQQS